MADHAYTPTASTPVTRRVLALGAGAFSAVGITAGATASVAGWAQQPDADAELIQVSLAFDALEDQYNETFRTMDEEAGDLARDRIVEQQGPLLDQMTALRAEGLEGLRARLDSLLLWDKELDFDDAECEGECFNTRLLAALLRDLDRFLPGRA